jgi:hypothetical protein
VLRISHVLLLAWRDALARVALRLGMATLRCRHGVRRDLRARNDVANARAEKTPHGGAGLQNLARSRPAGSMGNFAASPPELDSLLR